MSRTKPLQIRDVDEEIHQRLVKVAKKKGYKSRDEMLREVLTQIAYDEFQLDSEIRYRQFIEKQKQFMEWLAITVVEKSYSDIEKDPFAE
jgi:metal-responsive CopG/Arc/MetJ family transcriptional regulator